MMRHNPFVLAAAVAAVSFAAFGLRPAFAEDPKPAAAKAAPEGQQADDPEKERREAQQRAEDEVRFYPVVKADHIRQVVQFRIENNDLQLLTTLAPTSGPAKVEIKGFPGVVKITTEGGAGDGKPYAPTTFTYVHTNFTNPNEVIAITNIGVTADRLSIARDADRGDETVSVNLIQSGQYQDDVNAEKVRLYVQVANEKTGNTVVNLTLAALNVVDLRRKFPAETTTYLEPIFRELGSAGALFNVDPRAAWQVLAPAYEPPADVKEKVASLVKQLDADDPKARDAAAADLEKLGQPAALVLMRQQDRAGWSEEQTGRIDAFLAPYKPLPEDEAEQSRTDVEFLLLTLAADDDPLRQLALEQLRAVTKKPIDFDLKAQGQARHDAVSKLREELLGATTRPTTNPSPPGRSESAPLER
jgi:hypothetical protein